MVLSDSTHLAIIKDGPLTVSIALPDLAVEPVHDPAMTRCASLRAIV